VRFGYRPAETVHFELYEGDRVRVDEEKNGWVRVETHDGERGWTEASGLYFVGPPYDRFDRPADSAGQPPAAPGSAGDASTAAGTPP
jgi:hypothetical protein